MNARPSIVDVPHCRLLQGDVGSGKTIVSMLVMLATAQAGGQALMLAPTEILASQHYRVLTDLVESLPLSVRRQLGGTALSPVLLTGSTKVRCQGNVYTSGRVKGGFKGCVFQQDIV